MEKHKLLSVIKKTTNYFKYPASPTSIYESLWDDTNFKPLLDRMSPKDIVLYSFLIPLNNNGEDIDEIYDRIENNMYSIKIVEVYDSEPDVNCPDCNGYGTISCDMCGGDSEVDCRWCDGDGEENCDSCDGSGVDEEGEECDICQGAGKTTCARCNGSGTESCEYCDGDGENSCQTCNETGSISDENDAIIQIRNYISWSVRWKNYFSIIKDNEELDYEDAKNFGFNNQTLLLNYEEEISKNYEGYENGNTFLDSFKDTKEINIIQTKQGLTTN